MNDVVRQQINFTLENILRYLYNFLKHIEANTKQIAFPKYNDIKKNAD